MKKKTKLKIVRMRMAREDPKNLLGYPKWKRSPAPKLGSLIMLDDTDYLIMLLKFNFSKKQVESWLKFHDIVVRISSK